jgi:hypothetical protein
MADHRKNSVSLKKERVVWISKQDQHITEEQE